MRDFFGGEILCVRCDTSTAPLSPRPPPIHVHMPLHGRRRRKTLRLSVGFPSDSCIYCKTQVTSDAALWRGRLRASQGKQWREKHLESLEILFQDTGFYVRIYALSTTITYWCQATSSLPAVHPTRRTTPVRYIMLLHAEPFPPTQLEGQRNKGLGRWTGRQCLRVACSQ